MSPSQVETGADASGRRRGTSPRRVRIETLIDLDALARGSRPASPQRIRKALPAGWVLDSDGIHAVRDGRVLFRESWVLLTGLIVFGLLGGVFLVGAMPRGWGGWLRLAGLLALLLVVGGFVGPRITKGLHRR